MQVATGTVVNGKIEVEGVALPEGALVAVVTRGADEPSSSVRPMKKKVARCNLRDRARRVHYRRRTLRKSPQADCMALRVKIVAVGAAKRHRHVAIGAHGQNEQQLLEVRSVRLRMPERDRRGGASADPAAPGVAVAAAEADLWSRCGTPRSAARSAAQRPA